MHLPLSCVALPETWLLGRQMPSPRVWEGARCAPLPAASSLPCLHKRRCIVMSTHCRRAGMVPSGAGRHHDNVRALRRLHDVSGAGTWLRTALIQLRTHQNSKCRSGAPPPQAYAPLSQTACGQSLSERSLLLFACLAEPCRNRASSWRAVRLQMPQQHNSKVPTHTFPCHGEVVSGRGFVIGALGKPYDRRLRMYAACA